MSIEGLCKHSWQPPDGTIRCPWCEIERLQRSTHFITEGGTLVTDNGKIYVSVEKKEQLLSECEKHLKLEIQRLKKRISNLEGQLKFEREHPRPLSASAP